MVKQQNSSAPQSRSVSYAYAAENLPEVNPVMNYKIRHNKNCLFRYYVFVYQNIGPSRNINSRQLLNTYLLGFVILSSTDPVFNKYLMLSPVGFLPNTLVSD